MLRAANGAELSPDHPEWWVRAALANRRPQSRRWRQCVECAVSCRRARPTLKRAAELCASKSRIARLLGLDLLVAVALTRSPLWVDAAHVIDRLRYDRDERVRAHAVASFQKATCQGTTLERALRLAVHPDPIMRIRACVGLALERGRAARQALVRLAVDDSDDVREAALTSINLLQAPSDGPELEVVLAANSDAVDDDIRIEAQIGLDMRAIPYAPALPLLLQRGYLEPAALRAAAARRDPSYRPILETLRARVGADAPRRILALLDAAIDACTLPC